MALTVWLVWSLRMEKLFLEVTASYYSRHWPACLQPARLLELKGLWPRVEVEDFGRWVICRRK